MSNQSCWRTAGVLSAAVLALTLRLHAQQTVKPFVVPLPTRILPLFGLPPKPPRGPLCDADPQDPYTGTCDVPFGMGGGTPPEAERVATDLIIITAGTTVNFKVSMNALANIQHGGIHEVAIYDKGTTMDLIRPSTTTCPPGDPPDSPTNDYLAPCQDGVDYEGPASGAGHRLLLGPDADGTTRTQRIAGIDDTSFSFSVPGTYLVICNIRNHFTKRAMHQYVWVK